MIKHQKLLEEIASEGKYTFISTGMSNLIDIDNAVATLKSKLSF